MPSISDRKAPERAGRDRAGVDRAGDGGRVLEQIRIYSREHARLHAALVRVVAGGESVRTVAGEAGLDRKALGRHVRRFLALVKKGGG